MIFNQFPGLAFGRSAEADSRHRLLATCCPPALLALCLLFFTVSCGNGNSSEKRKGLQTVTINNTVPRRDIDGNIIDAHDGCLQYFGERFYLYGTGYGTNDGYTTANRFRVYSSPDLEQWTPAGDLLQDRPPGVYYRPYVVFNPITRKYVLWYNWYPRQWEGRTGVAISDSPVGPFTIVNTNVQLACSHAGDGSLFVDDSATGYYIYTAIDQGYAVRVERLTPDFLRATGETSDPFVIGAEAPVLFRRNDLYYALCGQRCAFCPEGSGVMVFISSSPLGPFNPAPNINRRPGSSAPILSTQQNWNVDVPGGKFAYAFTNHQTVYESNDPLIPAQETWVAKIPMAGEPAFVWMADRWNSAPDGVKGHDLQFWSSPLSFNPHNGAILPVKNVSRWDITWSWGD